VTWSDTTCPDGTNSGASTPETCVGHVLPACPCRKRPLAGPGSLGQEGVTLTVSRPYSRIDRRRPKRHTDHRDALATVAHVTGSS
jgi:hypothetical protein